MSEYVIVTGRFFDVAGTQSDIFAAFDEINEVVALEALATWNDFLGLRFQYQTGAYISGNVAEREGDGWIVHDDLAFPYGPWLEGVGSRNAPVTRFPGYHSLFDTFVQVDSSADEFAEGVVIQLVERLNAPA